MSLRKKLVSICHKVYQKGFVSAFDGNLSCISENGNVLITRSGICKGEVTEKDILEIDLKGNIVNGKGKLSTENKIHLFAYKKRKDIKAVVHCHPVYATVFALIGKGLTEHYLPEVFLTLGKVPLCKYATPSTNAVPESLIPYIDHSRAFLLENHGAVTLGTSLDDAYYKMEKLEQAAKIIYLAKLLDTPKKLSKKNINELFKLSQKTYGIELDKRNI